MQLFAPQSHNFLIDASESEETYFTRLQIQKLIAYSTIADIVMLIAAPAAIFGYGDPLAPRLGFIFLASAFASMLVKLALRLWPGESRYANTMMLVMSTIFLIPAACSTILRPDEEAGRAIVLVGVACSTYCFSVSSLLQLQALQIIASIIGWHWSDRAYGIDEFVTFFVAVPAVGFIIFESQRLSLSRSFRLQREAEDRRRELETTLQQLTTETELRHAEERLRHESEQRLQEQREQLLHVSRLTTMGELVAGIAHELHQPLHATSMYVGVLDALGEAGESVPCDRFRELTAKIIGLTQQSAATIRRLQNFVRRGPRVRVNVDVKDVIRDALELTATKVRHADVRVTINQPNEACLAEVDPVQIQQVVVNLVRNACDAMQEAEGEQRAIDISIRVESGCCECVIKDTGPGVTDEQRSRIFEAFESTKPDGLGMGLAISRSIIEDHGGQIELLSDTAAGATFRFTIPQKAVETQVAA